MNGTSRIKRVQKHVTISVKGAYSIIIGLIPVMMIYNVPIANIGLSTVLLGVTLPYAVLRLKTSRKTINMLPLILMFGYLFVRCYKSPVNFFLLFVALIHACGAAKGSINATITRKTIEIVALIETICVLLQTLLYYALGFKLQLIIPDLILEENRYALNSVSTTGSLYRPSAFFLEPSHFAQYCCVALMSVLFPEKGKKVSILKALWIVLGCVLTTSGMGIAVCLVIFMWYVLFTRYRKGTKLLYLIAWSAAGALAFVVLMQISLFSSAVQRVFGEVDGYNAIWGRTLFWDSYIGSMAGNLALFGHGVLNIPTGYMTGLMKVIYCYGYVGVSMILLLFVYLFFKSRNHFIKCASIVYCGLMCVANLFSFLSLSFWISIMIASIDCPPNSKKKWNLGSPKDVDNGTAAA